MKPGGFAIDQNMFVDFHVGHGRILLAQTALETAFATAEERELFEAGAAVAKLTPKKIHAESDIVAVVSGILSCAQNFLCQFWRERLIGIHQKYPIVGKRQR